MITEELEIGGYRILWVRKPIRRMHLRIKPPRGEITVSSPMRASRREVAEFVSSHLAWIAAKRPGCIVDDAPPALLSGEAVPLFGELLPLSVSLAGRASALLSDGEIRLCVRVDDPEHRRTALRSLYLSEIAARAQRCLAFWCERTGLAPEEISYRAMKTRWGSCQTVRKRITLNLRLAFFDPACLEYVVLHELVHLRHANHGKGFYAMLARYMPDWRERKRLLADAARDLRGREPL